MATKKKAVKAEAAAEKAPVYIANGTIHADGKTYHTGDVLPELPAAELARYLSICLAYPEEGGAV